MSLTTLTTPLKREEITALGIGDIVYLSGRIHTARDKAHERALELRKGEFPADLRGGVVFHCGPIVRKAGGSGEDWEIVSIGPTTSSRMNSVEGEFIDKFKIGAVIGKGGMDRGVIEAMKNRAVYLAMTGGCAATAASRVKKVVDVKWIDLGIPEAVWVLDVEKFGPLVVAIDSSGNSLYEDVKIDVEDNLKNILGGLK